MKQGGGHCVRKQWPYCSLPRLAEPRSLRTIWTIIMGIAPGSDPHYARGLGDYSWCRLVFFALFFNLYKDFFFFFLFSSNFCPWRPSLSSSTVNSFFVITMTLSREGALCRRGWWCPDVAMGRPSPRRNTPATRWLPPLVNLPAVDAAWQLTSWEKDAMGRSWKTKKKKSLYKLKKRAKKTRRHQE